MPPPPDDETRALLAAGRELAQARCVLRLYIAGMTLRSTEAIRRVTTFCEKYLPERYELEIIDIYQRPSLLKGEQIVAVPTLVKEAPEPRKRFIGDLHDEEKLLFGMDLVNLPMPS